MGPYKRKRSRQSIMRTAAVRCLVWGLAMDEARGFLALPCHRLDCTAAAIQTRLRPRSNPPVPAAAVASCSYQHPPSVETPLLSLREEVGVSGQESPLRGTDGKGPFGEDGDDEEEDFSINVGRALDYLAHDVPLMFSAPPRLEIFTPTIVLKDPVGELCHGRRLYGALHASLRVLGAITAVRPRVGVTCVTFNKDAREVELKWTMAANAPFVGQSALKLSAVSIYRVNDHGLIYEHSIDNRIKRDMWEYSHSWMGMLKADRPPSA